MKTQTFRHIKRSTIITAIILIFMGYSRATLASPAVPKSNQPDTLTYVQYKGSVTDQETRSPLAFASLTLNGTNIATVANSDGEFSLKVPKNLT